MSFFDIQTQVVEIDAENSITFRALTYGETENIKRQTQKVSAKSNGKAGKQEIDEFVLDYADMQRRILHKAIVSWEGPGFAGKPVTPENIDALPSFVLDPVIDAYNAISSPLTDEEKNA